MSSNTISDKAVAMEMETEKEIKETETKKTEMEGINGLPEECISHVISLTSPRDACVSAAVSRDFRSAADSNATWHRLLPSDYALYLSRAIDSMEYASKKELYFRLCDHPLIIDGGLMSIQLEESSGAKIFMLSARKLEIAWGDNPRYWEWAYYPDSRFDECLMERSVWWLEIYDKINSEILTPNTSYAAYLVFKLSDHGWGLSNPFQKTKVAFAGTESEHYVCLNTWERTEEGNPYGSPLAGGTIEEMGDDVIYPDYRDDWWWEVELGEFYNRDGMNEEVLILISEIEGGHRKGGLIVQGIEIRPKH